MKLSKYSICVCLGEFCLSLLPSAVCAFQSTNRPQVGSRCIFPRFTRGDTFYFRNCQPASADYFLILTAISIHGGWFEYICWWVPFLWRTRFGSLCPHPFTWQHFTWVIATGNQSWVALVSKTTDYPRIFGTNCANFWESAHQHCRWNFNTLQSIQQYPSNTEHKLILHDQHHSD